MLVNGYIQQNNKKGIKMARIQDFKSQMQYGGSRSNQFICTITFPAWADPTGQAGPKCQFLISSASLPEQTLGVATVPYRGREVKWAGDRTFAPWSVNVYNDADFVIRNAFELWSQGIVENQSNNGFTDKSQYQVNARVDQLDRNDNILKTYTFVDLWPVQIGDIALDFGANDQIEIFPVTFDYLLFETPTADASNIVAGLAAGNF